jgi:Kef-type K+ transport system membrane component KefB
MTVDSVELVLVGLAVIVVFARLLGAAARRLGQPAVIGEIVAGILLGPTFFHGAVTDTLFPGVAQAVLSAVATCGLALFMFMMGWELRLSSIRKDGRIALSVALGSVIVPFALGTCLALPLASEHANGRTAVFVLFFATAVSTSAFPVLARILADRGMHRGRLGSTALASAATADVIAWSILAVVIAVAGTAGARPWLIVFVVPYAALMVGVVRPALRRVATRWAAEERGTVGFLSVVLVGILLSGAATEFLGLHYIFGAFLFGAIMPRTGMRRMRGDIIRALGPMCEVLLLPVFFVAAGLQVNLSHVSPSGLGLLVLIIVVATTGKLVGAYTGAQVQGVDPRRSATLAVLMNTRGLTELIVLSIGIQLGVLDNYLYSLMVVMALVTTAMGGPLLRLLRSAAHLDGGLATGGLATTFATRHQSDIRVREVRR